VIQPCLASVSAQDFDAMATIRVEVLRGSLVRLGRFDAVRARERLAAGFNPADMRHIELDGQRVGYITLRSASAVCPPTRQLEHLYISNAYQNRGLGAWALDWAKVQAMQSRCGITLSALKQSDANRFYLRHGFVQVSEDEFDLNYLWRHNNEVAA
jgi:GNAT superfamily N-acetyltransferase